MKRVLLLVVLTSIVGSTVNSQSYETSISFDKKKQKAIAIDYGYSQEAVQMAIAQRIEKNGHIAKEEKGLFNKDKGFIIVKDAFVEDISDERMDYILKVERKSRRDKDESTLYLVVNKGGEDVIANMSAEEIRKVKAFLNGLAPDVEEANLELQIKSQDELVMKSEKKYKQLQEEKAQLEEKLRKNQEAITAQEQQIESQRSALELLKSKRKTAM